MLFLSRIFSLIDPPIQKLDLNMIKILRSVDISGMESHHECSVDP